VIELLPPAGTEYRELVVIIRREVLKPVSGAWALECGGAAF